MKPIDLDFEDVGSWPKVYKIIFILFASIVLGGIFYCLVLDGRFKSLKNLEELENKLKTEFVMKAEISSTLTPYKGHIQEVQKILNSLIYKLANKKELSSLLDDISFIGSHNGLQFKSINWGLKKQNEMAEEVPISIRVVGTYAQLGIFSSDIATLSRIVVLEDLRIKPSGRNGVLILDVVAKTYHYKEVR